MDNVEKIDIREYSNLELAYIGDSVWELEVRKYYLKYKYNLLKLNKRVKEKVNAKAQSLFYKKIKDTLDETYLAIGKRGKNARIKTFPNSCSNLEYREATAFEAIIGAMYIKKEYEKIDEVLKKVLEGDEDGIF